MRIRNKRVTATYEVGAPFSPGVEPVELGEFDLSPASVRCDEPYVLRVKYTVGEAGVAKGGGLMIRAHGAQFEDADEANYLAVSSSNAAASFTLTSKGYPRVFITTPDTVRHSVNWHAAVLGGADLAAGDVIEFTVGTEGHPRSGPSKRWRFRDPELPIIFYIDADGSGEYIELANSPTMQVLPAEAVNLHAFVRSSVCPGEELAPRAAVTDRFGNAVEAPAAVEIALDGAWAAFAAAPATGVCRPLVRSPRDGVELRHKPVQTTKNLPAGEVLPSPRIHPVKVVGDGDDRVFWGDIHFHSNFSQDVMFQGIENAPEDCYQYGRDVSGLDFAVLTDHHEPVLRTNLPILERGLGLTEELWERSKEVTDSFNEDGRFATFFGYEYRTQRGDTNVYFRDRDGAPYLPGQLDSMKRVREYCANLAFFSAPHLHPYSHQYLTLGPWKWDAEVLARWQEIGGDLEPVCEVFSRHGRYEFYGNQPHISPRRGMTEGNSAQAHLLRGHRFGLYAGSDDHWGRPGQDGLMAVYAPELTRAAVFEAIQKRRCYGTTNARILVDFRANGCFMGEECFSDELTRIQAEVHGTDVIDKVEIIRDGRIIHSVEPGREDYAVEYEDDMPVLGTCFYYLRVQQRDQHMAWSSPVWITSTQRIEDMHGDLTPEEIR